MAGGGGTPTTQGGAKTGSAYSSLGSLPTFASLAQPTSPYAQAAAQAGPQTQTSVMSQPLRGYGNFDAVVQRTPVGRPTPDQMAAQMAAYRQQYAPGIQQAQSEVEQYNARIRQAEADRKAEIARRAAEAAAEAERQRLAQESNSERFWFGDNPSSGGASGGLASLRGFE